MIDRSHPLPITKQAKVLGISRGSIYYLPRPVPAADLAIMRRMDELHLEFPFAGGRMLRDLLNQEGIDIGRRHVSTLMKRMGIEALYRKPNTSKPTPQQAQHRIALALARHASTPAQTDLTRSCCLCRHHHPPADHVRLKGCLSEPGSAGFQPSSNDFEDIY